MAALRAALKISVDAYINGDTDDLKLSEIVDQVKSKRKLI